jgi:hypothetical protein
VKGSSDRLTNRGGAVMPSRSFTNNKETTMNAIKLPPLSFNVLRSANVQRLPLFRNKHGQLCHNNNGSDWSDAQWLQAIAGEVGEYANVRKKFDRGDISKEEFLEQAASELADIFIYTDLLAFRRGILLEHFLLYTDIRSMQNDLTDPESIREEPTAEEVAKRLLGLVRVLGSLSSNLACYPNGTTRGKSGVFQQLHEFLEYTFHLADVLEIDLNNVVVKKFNKVSDRVQAPVYLVQTATTTFGDHWFVSEVPF